MATPKKNEHLKQMLHPYVFVLKEGSKIYENYLDYSLLMLQITSPEILPSPLKKKFNNPLNQPLFITSSFR